MIATATATMTTTATTTVTTTVTTIATTTATIAATAVGSVDTPCRRSTATQRGHALPPQYRDRGHYVTDYRSYRLREPPRGYRWVRADNDFVLVAITTGLIADIVINSQ